MASIFKAIFKIPTILSKIIGSMRRADHLHLRCPGNVGFLASICQIFFPHKLKTAKYAGNWDPDAIQPWSYKIQKWILSNTFLTRNMTVLVYGKWPDQSKNILPFFTASFSENEIEKIEKSFSSPYKFLFVGNLVPGKRPLFAIHLVEALQKRNIKAELHVYGDGEFMGVLQKHAGNKDYIHVHGIQPICVLKQAYEGSHFLILASKSEGWPKAVAEAMFYKCIPVATGVSCVPWMLGGGSRGILITKEKAFNWNRVESGEWKEDSQDGLGVMESGKRKEDSQPVLKRRDLSAKAELENRNVLVETADRIIKLLENPEEMKRMSREAREWSQEYTLEKFEEEVRNLLKQ